MTITAQFIPVRTVAHSATTGRTATDHQPVQTFLHDDLTDVGVDDHVFAAVQSDMEAEGTIARHLRPDRVRFSPGVAKGWCNINSIGSLDAPSYNVASVTDTGTGDRTIVWDDDFSSAGAQIVVSSPAQTTIADLTVVHGTRAVGSQPFLVQNTDGTDVDRSTSTIAMGDQ